MIVYHGSTLEIITPYKSNNQICIVNQEVLNGVLKLK